MTVGETTAEHDVPDAAKPPPSQDEAFVEFHDSVEDCPAVSDFGLAESVAVTVGSPVSGPPSNGHGHGGTHKQNNKG